MTKKKWSLEKPQREREGSFEKANKKMKVETKNTKQQTKPRRFFSGKGKPIFLVKEKTHANIYFSRFLNRYQRETEKTKKNMYREYAEREEDENHVTTKL